MSFWKGKYVLVTGGAGFLGSHLVEALIDRGVRVVVLDDSSRGSNRHPDAVYLEGDAGDLKSCRIVLESPYLYFAVFNLAASVAGVLYNQSHHSEMFERNIRLQTAPVIAAKETGVPHFLQVSSVCVYAPEYQVGAIEPTGHLGEPVGANAGYSWAKRMGERATLWADLPHVVIVRPSNMYGPRDYFDDKAHVIPNLIKKCLNDDPIITMKSPPDIKREFLYVADAVRGMMIAVELGEPNGIYNIGTNGATCISLRELLNKVQEACGTNKKITWLGGQAGGDPARWNNSQKINALGWYHTVALDDGLKKVVEWYTSQIESRVIA